LALQAQGDAAAQRALAAATEGCDIALLNALAARPGPFHAGARERLAALASLNQGALAECEPGEDGGLSLVEGEPGGGLSLVAGEREG
jgi:hypothetical protein